MKIKGYLYLLLYWIIVLDWLIYSPLLKVINTGQNSWNSIVWKCLGIIDVDDIALEDFFIRKSLSNTTTRSQQVSVVYIDFLYLGLFASHQSRKK